MAEEAARRGIDRYVPGGDGGGRDRSSRSPLPYRGRREGGRRPGARRDEGAGGSRSRRGGGGDGEHGRRGRDGRPRKTQEELDAEMADYFGNAGNDDKANGGAAEARPAAGDDIDMIE